MTDIEKKAEEAYEQLNIYKGKIANPRDVIDKRVSFDRFKVGFIAGYQSALSDGGERKYTEEELMKAQQAILGNHKDALMNHEYIIEYLQSLK